MAYSFGSVASDIIDMGTSVTHAPTFTLAVRFALTTSNNTEGRVLACYHDGTAPQNVNLFTQTAGGNEKLALLFSAAAGTDFSNLAAWESGGLTPGSIHTVMGVYDGALMSLFFDTDATAKATHVTSATPDQSTQHFTVGNQFSGTNSAHGTIYEAAWWPGVVLTGALCAQLGGGDASNLPRPTNYWGLLGDATDTFGGKTGTVTGATSAAGSGVNWFPYRMPFNAGTGRMVPAAPGYW
jgi:hypothetical protein